MEPSTPAPSQGCCAGELGRLPGADRHVHGLRDEEPAARFFHGLDPHFPFILGETIETRASVVSKHEMVRSIELRHGVDVGQTSAIHSPIE